MSLLFATLVINIKKKGERKPCPEVPQLLLKFCQKFLARVTCTRLLTYFDLYDYCELEKSIQQYSPDDDVQWENVPDELPAEGVYHISSDSSPDTPGAVRRKRYLAREHCESSSRMSSPRNAGYRSQRHEPPRDLRLEWYFVAQVIDKVLFILFLIAMALTVLFPLVIIPALHRND